MATASRAAEIVQTVFQQAPRRVERFATGAANYVFDVELQSGQRAVVRIARELVEAAATVHWYQTLRPMGVPLPKLIAFDASEGWIVIERLPGTDLGHAYRSLSREHSTRPT